MILYEHPFNERVRTWLRLEYLFDRQRKLLSRDDALDHHYALLTLFDLTEVAGRADLKSDVLQDLLRQKSLYNGYTGNPSVSENTLHSVLGLLEKSFDVLNAQRSKPGQALTNSEWLLNVRHRAGIPAGVCGFDLPVYHAWLYQASEVRRADLLSWGADFAPMETAITLLLKLLRKAGQAQSVKTQNGQYVQTFPQGRSYQLLRLKIDPALELVPEISAHRLAVSVNLTRRQSDGKTHQARQNVPLELTLCA